MAPLLANRARTAHVLSVALEDVMHKTLEGAKISIQQFVGRWVDIEIPQRLKLGIQNTHLGRNTVLGMRIYDRGGKFRVVIGPLSNRNFRRFLPDGDQIPIVREVCGLFLRDQLDFDLELVLSSDATPAFKLSTKDEAKLGIDTWLSSGIKEEKRVIVDVPFHGPPKEIPAELGDGESDGQPGADPRGAQASNRAREVAYAQTSGEGHHAR